MEISKFFPELKVLQQSCPMWVPLVENNEHRDAGADYFVKKYINEILGADKRIDCLLLACTHYPLLIPKIREVLPEGIRLLAQGEIVADSLVDYLKRHPEIQTLIGKDNMRRFFTSGDTDNFNRHTSVFFGVPVVSEPMFSD